MNAIIGVDAALDETRDKIQSRLIEQGLFDEHLGRPFLLSGSPSSNQRASTEGPSDTATYIYDDICPDVLPGIDG